MNFNIIEQIHLPDGQYNGLWSGYEIRVPDFNITFHTELGVRSFDIQVIVIVKDGSGTFKEGHLEEPDELQWFVAYAHWTGLQDGDEVFLVQAKSTYDADYRIRRNFMGKINSLELYRVDSLPFSKNRVCSLNSTLHFISNK